MSIKMKLPSFFSKPATDSNSYSNWSWPRYCQQPKTHSFRDPDTTILFTSPLATFTSSQKPDMEDVNDPVEKMIKGLKSERLFFEPEQTSSILDEANHKVEVEASSSSSSLLEETVVLTMDSRDPYLDFKKSMEEMVEAHGLRDSWEDLHQLLCCYLRLNWKGNHGYIVGAFIDLLVGYVSESSSSSDPVYPKPSQGRSTKDGHCYCHRSPSSPLSFENSSSSLSGSSSCSYDCSSSNPCAFSSVLESRDGEVSFSSPLLNIVNTIKDC